MRLVCLGDSFTEGVGDELQDGSIRGWSDIVAAGLAIDQGGPIEYANLAVRGKLMEQIVAEQLEPALALEPTLLTFNGGGNDMLRPGADLRRIRSQAEYVVTRCLDAGVRPVLLSGGNPTRNLPMGRRTQRKGDLLTAAVKELTAEYDIPFVNVWADTELARADYWADDRLHLNAIGHHRAAAHVLRTLGAQFPQEWLAPVPRVVSPPSLMTNAVYYRRYVVPWIRRRLTGRSSGDGRLPKYARWRVVEPSAAD
ncbi:SGNH/GDSL hydrolase family protein [Phytoactinopolyspora mesophila]|uniref:SGNH/GDSL hydrolase family protein n=1 Tax=Phytoactinopolyspora mesophila TaxID=2650750 RepID=A0A7K3M778_9ACTN|nr:SGNH/GDSL hydrolase family protein [Phytoactinopolyspora mesophila]NDL59124.1 SGNH/GDSL hydrolase family protein [Phytoactinopolyspora mesophila]